MLAPVLLTLLFGAASQAPAAFEVRDIAEYRLTAEVFERFDAASRLIAAATRDDRRYADAPLLTRDIVIADDVVAAASELQRRLTADPALVQALTDARLTAREFTLFAINLFAARLVHGFLETGAMRRVPPGVTADNVAFVGAHREAISAVLEQLGIED